VNKFKLLGVLFVIAVIAGLVIKLYAFQAGGSAVQSQATKTSSAIEIPKIPGTTHAQTPSDISILKTPVLTSQFMPGATFTQEDSNFHNPQEQMLLAHAVGYLNVFIDGWGTDNPEPSPGQYEWSTLDERVNVMRQVRQLSGGRTQLMISLCCAPDWMKTGSDINTAPNPQNFADFAELSKQVAKRYPDVKYFQVWNELKGFDNTSHYIQLYNDVYDAIKSVRTDAIVGGPYDGIEPGNIPDTIASQWLREKHGANIIAVDGGFDSSSAAADFSDAQFYLNYAKWLRQQSHGGATLPFGWAEWYPGTVQQWGEDHFNATMANAMIATVQSGASYALMWGLEGGINGVYKEGDGQQLGLINNVKPTAWYHSVKDFYDYFGPGTQVLTVKYRVHVHVTVLASASKTMLVNQLARAQTLTVNGVRVSLNPYQVLVMNTPL
jgi:hypothetical protein